MTPKLQGIWKKKWVLVFLVGLFLGFGLGYAVCDVSHKRDEVTTPVSVSIEEMAVVERVIDGDTIELADGRRVRYVGINTPEMGRGGKPDECFAREAKEKNRELVEGKEVRLVRDVSEKDIYGRWLYVVFVGDLSVSEILMRGGYAKEMTIEPDTRFAGDIREWGAEAREKHLGVWGCS